MRIIAALYVETGGLFDVHGYLVIEGLLSPEEVRAANAAVDSHAGDIRIRPCDLANGSRTLEGTQGRGDLGGMLTWEKPHCDVFREMIAHANSRASSRSCWAPGSASRG